MKIAYFSPLPPDRSGIAAYSAALLPHLADHAELTLFTDRPETAVPLLPHRIPMRPTASFAGPLREGVDLCLYQMGNNALYHTAVYPLLRRYPGLVTLHDLNLHSFYGDLYVRHGRLAAYAREMAFSYGAEGVAQARRARRGRQPYNVADYPLFGRVVAGSQGVIVHSQYAAAQIRHAYPLARLAVIPLVQTPGAAPDERTVAAAKARLGYGPEVCLLAAFGYAAPSKRLDVGLRAFAGLHGRFPHLRYALVGQEVEGYNLDALLAELNLNNELVRRVGYADAATYADYLTATDIGLNLRYPTLGESSGTLLQLLAAGKATLISQVDAFAELPATAVIPIPIGPEEAAVVETAVADLITNESRRRAIGAAAARLVAEQHAPAAVARQYAAFWQTLVAHG